MLQLVDGCRKDQDECHLATEMLIRQYYYVPGFVLQRVAEAGGQKDHSSSSWRVCFLRDERTMLDSSFRF